jgi:hypothetical protein
MLPAITGITGMYHHAQLFSIEMESIKLLFLSRLSYIFNSPGLSLLSNWDDKCMPSFWLRWDLANFLPRLASNFNPLDLILPSS